MSEVKDPSYYNANIPEDLSLVTTWRDLYNKVIDFLPADTNTAIADLGCGPGFFAKVLYERGYRIYWGIDFSKVYIEMARKAVPEFKFTSANLYHKVIREGFKNYDVFTLVQTLEHLRRDLLLLKAIPQGRKIIFSVPNTGGEGHVRVLVTQKEVAARYESIIEFSDTLVLSGSKYVLRKKKDNTYIDKVFFLVHGKRR